MYWYITSDVSSFPQLLCFCGSFFFWSGRRLEKAPAASWPRHLASTLQRWVLQSSILVVATFTYYAWFISQKNSKKPRFLSVLSLLTNTIYVLECTLQIRYLQEEFCQETSGANILKCPDLRHILGLFSSFGSFSNLVNELLNFSCSSFLRVLVYEAFSRHFPAFMTFF